MPQFHFISGMNRSGSTMLTAILRQNPLIHSRITSPVHILFRTLHRHMGIESDYHLMLTDEKRLAVLRGVILNYYQDCDRPIIFDLHKWWSSRMSFIALAFPEAKVLCPVRDPCWCIDSYERIFQAHPLRASRAFSYDQARNVYTRVESLVSATGPIGLPYNNTQEAFYGPWRDRLIFIDYEDMCQHPNETMAEVYRQLGMDYFQHDFNNLVIPDGERLPFDFIFGIPMHRIRPKLEWAPRRTILPPDLFSRFENREFWLAGKQLPPHPLAGPQAQPSHSTEPQPDVEAV